jgi:hypothetical protein
MMNLMVASIVTRSFWPRGRVVRVALLSAVALALTGTACAAAPKRAPSYAGGATTATASYSTIEGVGAADMEMIAMTGDDAPAPSAAQPAPAPAPALVLNATPTGATPTGATPTGATPTGAVVVQREQPQLQQKLVVEGWINLEVEEVPQVAVAVRERVQTAGGRVVNEQLSGGERSWSGQMQVKLPPDQVAEFLDWLARQGDIQSKRIQGTDVSRTLFDQQIALDNLQLTLDRMRKLLDREGLAMQDILAIEREMTRLRGEIERIKGEKRFLEHRVALATLDINLSRREGVILGRANAKFYPGPRLSALLLFDAGDRERLRLGGGVAIHIVQRLTLELDVFERAGDESRAVLATFGGSFYSDFLGRGRNRFLNPYLGFRMGYGYLDGSAFVFAGGGGVELFKHKYLMIDVNARVMGFARENFDVALVTGGGVVVAF